MLQSLPVTVYQNLSSNKSYKSSIHKNMFFTLFLVFVSQTPFIITTKAFTPRPIRATRFSNSYEKISFSDPWNRLDSSPCDLMQERSSFSNTGLCMRQKTDWFDEKEDSQKEKVRFLGKGSNAIVRPGVVLVAPVHEYHHFLMKSAVFIHAIGLNEYGEHVTRGVIIDHPTAFTMGEMSAGSVVGVLGNNILFQGGNQGNDSAIMLHSLGDENIGDGKMIGTSKIYEGGLGAALAAADEGEADPDKFKFFFNYMEFTDNELQSMLNDEDSEGDAWISVEVPVDMILDSDLDRGDAWRSLRNQLKQMTM